MKDTINPDYYKDTPFGLEVIEITQHYDFCIGNALKYIFRAGKKHEQGMKDKEKHVDDLKKAVWYLNAEIKKITEGEPKERKLGSICVHYKDGKEDTFSSLDKFYDFLKSLAADFNLEMTFKYMDGSNQCVEGPVKSFKEMKSLMDRLIDGLLAGTYSYPLIDLKEGQNDIIASIRTNCN